MLGSLVKDRENRDKYKKKQDITLAPVLLGSCFGDTWIKCIFHQTENPNQFMNLIYALEKKHGYDQQLSPTLSELE